MTVHTTPNLHELRLALRDQRSQLTAYLQRQRWFRSKARRLIDVDILDLALIAENPWGLLMVVGCRYEDDPSPSPGATRPFSELYQLVTVLQPAEATAGAESIVTVPHAGRAAVLRDAIADSRTMCQLADGIHLGAEWHGLSGTFRCTPTLVAGSFAWPPHHAQPLGAEQSNSSILLDRALVLKVLRKIEVGMHPDLEVLSFLTSRMTYSKFPRLVGAIEYHRNGETAATALLQEFVTNVGDGWSYVLTALKQLIQDLPSDIVTLEDPPQTVRHLAANMLRDVETLGEITGDLHVTLGSDASGTAFSPEVIAPDDVTAWHSAMLARLDAVVQLMDQLSTASLSVSRGFALPLLQACRDRFTALFQLNEHAVLKIRQHGDYHLGQVLKQSESPSFVVLDFEGEPARPLWERRAKSCVLKDVAGMVRSFHYAAEALMQEHRHMTVPQRAVLSAWAELASETFLRSYVKVVGPRMPGLLPPSQVLPSILCAFQIDKAVYELGYELNNRPAWVQIPLRALQRLCGLLEHS